MYHQNKSARRRPATGWSSARLIRVTGSLSLILLLLLVSASEAIVKQQLSSPSSSASSPSSPSAAAASSSSQSQSQQSRSDDAQAQAAQSQQQQQSAYNNHQSQASQSAGSQSQPSYSSSVSISSSASQAQPQSISSSQQGSGAGSSLSASNGPSSQMSASLQPQNGQFQFGNSMKQQSTNGYLDNPEHSYQMAANSVNMALANSGIYNQGYGSQAAASQQPSGASSAGAQQPLNPLHYFYYPPKDSSAASQQSQPKASGPVDSMANAASSNYPSMAYPSYADQLSNAFSSLSGAEGAASNQEPSYMPQPGADQGQFGAGAGTGNGAAGNQNQAGGPSQMYGSGLDMGFAGNMNPSQQQQQQQSSQQQGSQHHNSPSTGGISFSGPSSGSSMGADYLGPHGSQGGYQASSVYNQMNDLQTSNFGNNPGGLSSVASYMSPGGGQAQQSQSQQPGNQAGQPQHDLFGAGSLSPFSSAASQLSPAAVSPPGASVQNNAAASASSSLFGSSLYSGSQQPQQQQQAQQQVSAGALGGSGLFSGQSYLNSFLSPQQYTQLTGQQVPSVDMMQSAGSSVQASQQQQPAAAASSSVASSGSNKRFGISSFIMPMLALAGLSLLIPTMSNIGTAVGRKKRSVEDRASAANRQQSIAYESMNGMGQLAKEHSIGEYMDKIERYYSIYKNAVESDDCLNRLICEFGDAVKDVTGKSAIVTVIERLVPNWMVGKVHLFKEAALESKEGKEKCKKYICRSNKHQ